MKPFLGQLRAVLVPPLLAGVLFAGVWAGISSLGASARADELLNLNDDSGTQVLFDGLRAEKAGHLRRAELLLEQAAILPDTQEPATVSLARVLVAEGMSEDAKRTLQNFVTSVNPFSVDAHLALIDIYITDEDVKDADAQIAIVAKLRPGYEPFQERRAILAFKTGDYTTATVLLTHVLQKEPQNTNAIRLRHDAYVRTHQFVAATEDMKRILKLEPGLAKNYLLLAADYDNSHDYDQALTAIETGLASPDLRTDDRDGLRTTAAETYAGLADSLIKDHDFASARKVLKRALKFHATSPLARGELYFEAGKFLELLKDRQGAMKFYAKAFKSDPQSLKSGLKLAELQSATGEYEQSAGTLMKILSVDPGNPQAARKLVELYAKADRGDSLGLFLKDYVDENPGATWAMVRYMKLLDSIGDHAEEEATLARAIDDDSSTADTYLLYVRVLDRARKYDKSASVLTVASQRFPNDARIRFDLGLSYEHAGKYARAERAYKSVPTTSPDLYYEARVNLALYQQRRGDAQMALSTLKELKASVGEDAELDAKIAEISKPAGAAANRGIASKGDKQ